MESVCLACEHDLFQAIALEPEADDSRRFKNLSSYSLGFPFTWGLIRSFTAMFFVFFFSFVRPESEDLRIDIAVLLESLIMGSFQAATPPPRINAFLVGDTKIPTNPHTP